MARAPVYQPLRDRESEAAQATGDQIRAVIAQLQRSPRCWSHRYLVILHRHDYLADMLRLRQMTERAHDVRNGEHAVRQRVERAVFESLHDVTQERLDELGPLGAQLVQINGEQ